MFCTTDCEDPRQVFFPTHHCLLQPCVQSWIWMMTFSSSESEFQTLKKRNYIWGLCRLTRFDNCGVWAWWNVFSFPLLKPGMWEIVDVRIILPLSSGIKVYSYFIKVFSAHRTIVETAVFFPYYQRTSPSIKRRLLKKKKKKNRRATKSFVFSFTESVGFEPTEARVRWLGSPQLIGLQRCSRDGGEAPTRATLTGEECVEWVADQQNVQLVYMLPVYFVLIELTAPSEVNCGGINKRTMRHTLINNRNRCRGM